ncbi:MAG: phosphopantetheine-binding protein [Gammaproteobacteria bacterium]|nr:phosphopantetheine-binding protein [Gammaproteobacteria bacterium]
MSQLEEVLQILGDVLQITDIKGRFDRSTMLLGGVPEFDSMAVVSVITALEENYGFVVDDDEIDAETFESVGSLVDFVEGKLNT